jgi:hypothetical protein
MVMFMVSMEHMNKSINQPLRNSLSGFFMNKDLTNSYFQAKFFGQN